MVIVDSWCEADGEVQAGNWPRTVVWNRKVAPVQTAMRNSLEKDLKAALPGCPGEVPWSGDPGSGLALNDNSCENRGPSPPAFPLDLAA